MNDPWTNKRRIRVYYAAPYSKPYPIHNMKAAMDMWLKLWQSGYIPTCPHWTGFQDLVTPLSYEQWLEYDLLNLPNHHVILRGEGVSSGADGEVKEGRKIGMPICYSIEELLEKYPPTTNPTSLPYNPFIIPQPVSLPVEVSINGRMILIDQRMLSYNDIVLLAATGRKALHSVVFHRKTPHPHLKNEGTLLPKQSVTVSEGLSISAVVTDNA